MKSDSDDDLKDYRILASRIKKYGNRSDLSELFRRMTFNALVRNIDDHVRNHGFLMRNGRLSLSPAYDITVHDMPIDMEKPAMMAMKMGIMGVWGSLDNIISSVAVFGVDADWAKKHGMT